MATTAGTIKHRHQSFVATGTSDVDVPQWNDSEVVAGGTNGDVLARDSTQGDGWGWTSPLTIYPGPATWVNVAYSASNFFGTGTMNWTVDSGDQSRFAYLLSGKTMTVSFYFDTTTTSGTATNEVRVIIPAGATVKSPCIGPLWIYNGTTGVPGMVRGLTGQNYLSLFRADFANHAIVTNAMVFGSTFTFEIT